MATHSSNTFAFFETQYDQRDESLFEDRSFPSHYAQVNDLDDYLVDVFNETSTKLGFGRDLDKCLALDKGRDLHMIQSIVGDDEHTTTDSYSLGPALIGFGPKVLGIRLSWKDTGISHYVGNYAEGWILTPPSAESTFEVTSRRHARSGVPFTLDGVKLKLLSPVRKQSPTWELDLESKLEQLAEMASWTDRRWFTYDYHQMMLVISLAIFDFEDASSFPYLFKTEGGSGGAPPYGNLDTVYSALHFYTRGRSRSAILGVMEEAVAVNTGSVKPNETFFLRNSHLANLGDKAWLRYESAYRTMLEHTGLSKIHVEDLLTEQEAEPLPDYIRLLGTEVEPHSYVAGANLSSLRKEGLIMSELDVKAALDARERTNGILGEEPIGKLKKRLELESAAFRGKHLKILSQISDMSPHVYEGLKSRGMLMPRDPGQVFRSLATSYFSMRTEEYSRYSSLHYTDTIRVFKTEEVNSILERGSRAVREDFARTESFPKGWVRSFLEENYEERKVRTDVHSWFNSKPLGELLYNPLPPGVGTDDARIARNILEVVREHSRDESRSCVVILFSGDRQLGRLTTQLVRENYNEKKFRLIMIDRSMYTRMCLSGAHEYARLRLDGKLKPGKSPWRSTRPQGWDVTYWNYILKSLWTLPEAITSQIRDMACVDPFHSEKVLVHVEYDYPNMEKGLDLIRVDHRTGTVEEYGGGYLEGRTLRGLAQHECWAKKELGEIFSWPDFDIFRSKRHYALPKRAQIDQARIQGFDPTSLSTYSRVEAWRSRTAMQNSRRLSRRSSSQSTSRLGSETPYRGS